MVGVVVDARHHVGAAEALRVFERRVGDELAGLEVDQAQDDGRRAEVHRDAVDRAGRAVDLDAVEEDAVAVARDARVERHLLPLVGQAQGVALDAHLAAAHRVAFHLAVVGGDEALAGQAEVVLEVLLGVGGRREQVHALGDFDDALLALAVLAARGRHLDAEPLGAVEERPRRAAASVVWPLMVQRDGHA